MKRQYLVVLILAMSGLFFSCNKKTSTNVSAPNKVVGHSVAPGNISGAIEGTMTSGNTYVVVGNITVPKGDTLYIQNNVKVIVNGNFYIYVAGTLVSNGTQNNQVWITYNGSPNPSTGMSHADNVNENDTADPALKGWWQGIICDTSCHMLALHWTHLEFCGKPTTTALGSIASGATDYAIYYGNPNGFLIIEDCWIYGTADDAVRMQGGRIWIARNTLEKAGNSNGGDGFNAKGVTTGDMCYNLCVGNATNSTKASDKGAPTGATTECNINMYNNTYVDCGFRNTTAGKGANIDYEQSAEGMAYNNLMIDCHVGLRILTSPAADTNHCYYGNQFYYVDDTALADNIYPVPGPSATHPELTDIPLYTTYLPVNFHYGYSYYNAPGIVGKNNPNFVNFPLPNSNFINTDFAEGFDFHLQSNSPCIGKGYTAFSALATSASPKIPVDAVNGFGATQINPPGADNGAYQSNGTGNQQTH